MNTNNETLDRTVVINATNLGRQLDGIGTYTLNLLRELSNLDADIRFVVYLNRSSEQHLKNLSFPENFTLRWVSNLISPDRKFMGHLLRLLYSNFLGLKHLRSLIFNTSQLEAIFFRSNQVITIHDVIPLLFKKCHRKQHYYYEHLLIYALRRARIVITPSQHTKGLLELCYGLNREKIRVIHHGARGAMRKGGELDGSREPGFILYVGRLVRMKNVAGVLRAFATIKDMIDHRLVITGSGGERLKKEFEVGRLSKYDNENDRVVFKGNVSGEEMADLLTRASLLVFPSFYEGFGLPPLEAMACDCPAVVSNVASLPEVCGDAALYINPHEIDSIAEGMLKVLTDSSLREELTRRGRERAKLFDWEQSAKSHLKVFEEAMASSRSTSPRGTYAPGYVAIGQHGPPAGVLALYGTRSGLQK